MNKKALVIVVLAGMVQPLLAQKDFSGSILNGHNLAQMKTWDMERDETLQTVDEHTAKFKELENRFAADETKIATLEKDRDTMQKQFNDNFTELQKQIKINHDAILKNLEFIQHELDCAVGKKKINKALVQEQINDFKKLKSQIK